MVLTIPRQGAAGTVGGGWKLIFTVHVVEIDFYHGRN